MTKYAVSGYIGFDNFGDEAIAAVLTDYLKKNNAEKITLLSAAPKKTSNLYGVNSVYMLNFFKTIIESDVLISGGGSLLQDVTSLKSLLYYLSVIMFALVCGKKVIIFAQGFTPFRTEFGRFMTEFVLKRCHLITVRDSVSQQFLKKMKIESLLIGDPVYAINIPAGLNHSGIGIQLRSCPAVNDDFLFKLAKTLTEKYPNEEFQLFSLQDSLDMPVLEKFAGMISSFAGRTKIHSNMTAEEIITEISGLKILISMRFHSCVISAKAGVKTLGLNYDVKVKNLSEAIGFPCINLLSCDVSEGLEELDKTNPEKYNYPRFNFPDINI